MVLLPAGRQAGRPSLGVVNHRLGRLLTGYYLGCQRPGCASTSPHPSLSVGLLVWTELRVPGIISWDAGCFSPQLHHLLCLSFICESWDFFVDASMFLFEKSIWKLFLQLTGSRLPAHDLPTAALDTINTLSLLQSLALTRNSTAIPPERSIGGFNACHLVSA